MPSTIHLLNLCATTPAHLNFDAAPRQYVHADPEFTGLCQSDALMNFSARVPSHRVAKPADMPAAHRAPLSQAVLATEIPPTTATRLGDELALDYEINGAAGPLDILELAALPLGAIGGPIVMGLGLTSKIATAGHKLLGFFKNIKWEQWDLAKVYGQAVEQSLKNSQRAEQAARKVSVNKPRSDVR